MTEQPLQTRAVEKPVNPGHQYVCAHCEAYVKFAARQRPRAVICNVYVDGRWDRVEAFHPDCYRKARSPHGPVDRSQAVKRLR